MRERLNIMMELGKVRISLPISLSALTGYVLYKHQIDVQAWLLALGVFFMSFSSSAFNHWQESTIDSKMPRTQKRPIPSGKISKNEAFLIASVYALFGSAILFFSNPPSAVFLSWLTLFFYNLVYTPLKKVSAFAVIPGSFVGALPPMIGWAGAGGDLFSEKILLVAAFFFIGQIPHFWLLLLMFGEQYRLAGLPSLNQIFSDIQIKRITYCWVLTTIASALLVVFYVIIGTVIKFLLLFYAFYLLVFLTIAIIIKGEIAVRPSFFRLNLMYLFMMIFLIIDSLYAI